MESEGSDGAPVLSVHAGSRVGFFERYRKAEWQTHRKCENRKMADLFLDGKI